MAVAPREEPSEDWKTMEQPDKSDLGPADAAPEPDDVIDGGGPAAEADFDASVTGDVGLAGAFQRQLTEEKEKYLRLAAEYENYRKRTTKERAEAYSRAQADLAKQLLDALDDLARFAHVDPSTVDASTVVQGVDMVEKKALKALTGAGLEIIDPTNQSFDPKLHEAVATEPALSPEDDHVVSRVYQAGYLFNGQLLRPARVVVKQWNG
jgi:molecular chaperone GrpE